MKLGLSLADFLHDNPKTTVKQSHPRISIASLPILPKQGDIIYPGTAVFLDEKLVGITLFPAVLRREPIEQKDFKDLQAELQKKYLDFYGGHPEKTLVPGPHAEGLAQRFTWVNSDYVVTLTMLPSKPKMYKLEMLCALIITPTQLYFRKHNWTQDDMNQVESIFHETGQPAAEQN